MYISSIADYRSHIGCKYKWAHPQESSRVENDLTEMGCIKIDAGPPQFVVSVADDATNLFIQIQKLFVFIKFLHKKEIRYWTKYYNDFETEEPKSSKTLKTQERKQAKSRNSTNSRKSSKTNKTLKNQPKQAKTRNSRNKTLKINDSSSSSEEDSSSSTETETSGDDDIIHKVFLNNLLKLANRLQLKEERQKARQHQDISKAIASATMIQYST